MMEVLTLPIQKTPTCPTLPSYPLTWPLSPVSTGWGWRRFGSGLSRIVGSWPAGLSSRTGGAAGAGAEASRDTR